MATGTLMQRYTEYNDRLKAQGIIPEAPPQPVDFRFQDGRTESVDVSKAEHVLELGGFAPKV